MLIYKSHQVISLLHSLKHSVTGKRILLALLLLQRDGIYSYIRAVAIACWKSMEFISKAVRSSDKMKDDLLDIPHS